MHLHTYVRISSSMRDYTISVTLILQPSQLSVSFFVGDLIFLSITYSVFVDRMVWSDDKLMIDDGFLPTEAPEA